MKELSRTVKRRISYDELRRWARTRKNTGKQSPLICLQRYRLALSAVVAFFLVGVIFPFLINNYDGNATKFLENFNNPAKLSPGSDRDPRQFQSDEKELRVLNRVRKNIEARNEDHITTVAPETETVPETTATTLAENDDDVTTTGSSTESTEITEATTLATTLMPTEITTVRAVRPTTANPTTIPPTTTMTIPPSTTDVSSPQPVGILTEDGEVDGDSLRLVLIAVAAGAGTVALILLIIILIFCCCPCACCFASLCCKRYRVEPPPEMVNASTMPETPEEPATPEAWAINEELLRDAIQVGKVSVLEFTLKEVRWLSPSNVDADLVAEAEDKLNIWKRTTAMLGGAVKSKDIPAVMEYMSRYENLNLNDESGVYERASEILDELNRCLAELEKSSQIEDESGMLAALAQLNGLGISSSYTNKLEEVRKAKTILDEIERQKLLQGRTEKELETSLKEAIQHRDALEIKQAISQIETAGITIFDPLVVEGKRVLKDLEDEREDKRDDARQKLFDALQKRDADALRSSLRECAECGVDVQQIREGEQMLKTFEREDQLLVEIASLIQLRDSAKLLEAVAVFRTRGLDLVDKTGDVARADELIQELREKERLKRAKGDAMWRLQNARNVGDVAMMENMIKVLENLAFLGEEIDEALILRARAELEAIRGEVDYRKRMESIKSAIARMIAAENLPQLFDLIEQMVELSLNENYTMTADDTRVLDESRVALHNLRRKHDIVDEMDKTRPVFSLPQTPDYLDKLKAGVETMTRLKESAAEFDGVFRPSDDDLLATATINTKRLEEKVEEKNQVESKLRSAVDAKNHSELLEALAEARKTEFIDLEEIAKAQDLCDFINPKKRVNQLKKAILERDVASLTQEIDNFILAGVSVRPELLEKAQQRLKKLKKAEKNKRKEEKRQKREEARRNAEINALNEKLKQAMDARDIDELQNALRECEESNYPETEIALFKEAEKLLDELTIERLRQNLLEAIERRDIFVLEKGIDEAEYGGYVEDLEPVYRMAKDLLFHLRELHSLREAISGMNRSLLSEISRYPKPPYPVGVVMTAAMVMLGEKKSNVSKWTIVQAMLNKLGNESVTRRVKRRAPGDITANIRDEVENLLEGLDLATVQEKSSCAASFFAWMKCMIKESYYASRPSDFQPTSSMPHLVDYQ